ncbi:hypothetical protein [Hyphomicrobium sp.]|uniref:hypothetical protein n=1 Tax=Hyphomicrobium sp. TaxID=82 RepID=UPI0025BCFAE1|nr:hypothetical protein [Hyphomicrobium sp.]MCC7253280.1 hypothetical protein [Hyphomicrobium sp.]
MTMRDGRFRKHVRRFTRLFRMTVLALVLAILHLISPTSAQQSWTPTIATTPDGSLPGALNREATRIDPRYFPSPRAAPAPRNPLPQGAWSPIVTGALPGSAGRPPAQGANRGTEARDALTPVRPTPRQAVAAAGANGTGDAVEAETPARESAAVMDGAAEGPLFKKPGPLDALPPDASAAQQYCFNTADSAADARFAWQAKKIQDMEAELDKKARQLEAKTQEYKHWLERRDDFSRKAHEKLVGFYSRMRADAAAVQLATLDEEMAAAVVMKLETKVASQIMGEMDPERAAKIATIISGAAKIPRGQRTAAPAAASPPDGSPASQDAALAPGGT